MMRLFVGPEGAEIIGRQPDGTPVLADADGAGAMVEITGISNVRLTGGLFDE